MGIQKLEQREISSIAFLRAACIAPTLLLLGSLSVSAQIPSTGFSGISGSNSKKPIDIVSDRLEVDDKKQTAIFIGNVSATQGEYNLRSPRLEVTYEHSAAAGSAPAGQGKAAQASKPAQPQKAATNASTGDPLSSGQIKHIRATGGKVLLVSTKDKQEATGNEAFYDVKAQKVTMTGNVTLSQKGNVVTGQKLLIDLETGRAVVDPHEGGDGTHERVRALLVPSGNGGETNPLTGAKKKPKTPDKAADKQSTPSSGWQAQPR